MPNRTVGQLVAHQQILTATPDMSVAAAAAAMCDARVGAILVVKDDTLVGIFTERDALNRVLAVGKDSRHTSLGEVMTANPMTVNQNLSFRSAFHLMHEHGFRHVPVVNGGGTPIGVVSVRDALGQELSQFEADQTERQHLTEILG